MSTRNRINRYYRLSLAFAMGSYEDFKSFVEDIRDRPYKERRYVLSCLWHRHNRWALNSKGYYKLDGYNTQMFVLNKALGYMLRKKSNDIDFRFAYGWIRDTMPWLWQYGDKYSKHYDVYEEVEQ